MKTIKINIVTKALEASMIFPEIHSLKDQEYLTAAVMEFEETELGRWCDEHKQDDIEYNISHVNEENPNTPHLRLTARVKLDDRDATAYQLKWGSYE